MIRQGFPVVVVYLIAVPVALVDGLLSVEGAGPGGLVQHTGVGAQPQGAAYVLHSVLLRHQMDHRMGGGGIQLRAVGVGPADHIPGKFHDGKLHAKAQAEKWNPIFPGILDGANLAVNSPASEAAGNQDA